QAARLGQRVMQLDVDKVFDRLAQALGGRGFGQHGNFSLLCGGGHTLPSQQTKKQRATRLDKKSRIQTPVGAPDPFHMPTGLADGLGVESLPRCSPQHWHRYAPVDQDEFLHPINVAEQRTLRWVPRATRWLGRLRRSSESECKNQVLHVKKNFHPQSLQKQNFPLLMRRDRAKWLSRKLKIFFGECD